MCRLSIITFGMLLIVSGCSHAIEGPSLRALTANQDKVGRFELFELTFEPVARYENPFDPDEIDVEATFTSPSGRTIRVPGFVYQEFRRSQVKAKEVLEKAGGRVWKVRFAPSEEGRYEYFVTVKDGTGQAKSTTRSFTVCASKRDGFIRRSPNSDRYLAFENGKDYFAVGENVAWVSQLRKTYAYEQYLGKLAENGCNYTRVWMVSWGFALEWSRDDPNAPDGYGGMGRYSEENAWRLDRVLQEAEARGIHLTLALGNYGDLMAAQGYWNEQRWSYNPYNAAQGGPCKSPEEFWTNESARSAYKKRLRYIIARWGYSTSLLSLEFWNEVAAPHAWVSEMARYLKEQDPFGHLVTISLGNPPSADYRESRVWELGDIDFIQIHLYGYSGNLRDLIPELSSECLNKGARYRKPCLIAEFGIDSGKDDKYYDKSGKGVNLHNGLWAAACSGACGGAMNWWWDTYVDKKDLYYHYRALSNFAKTIEWSKRPWERLEVTPPVSKESQGTRSYSDVVIRTKDEWRKVDVAEYTVGNDGQVAGGAPNKYLHGTSKEDLRVTPIFHVNYPVAGKFIIHVGTVSQGAHISVDVDEKKVFEKEMPASEHVPGKEGRSEYKKEWDIWWCHYNEDLEVELSPGPHVVRLVNTGPDWAGIDKVVLTNYRESSYLNVRVIGLARGDEAIAWVQNMGSDWYNNFYETAPETLRAVTFDVLSLQDGDYRVEWWDTYKGEVVKRETAKSEGGKVRLEIPELTTDIACTLRRM